MSVQYMASENGSELCKKHGSKIRFDAFSSNEKC
jgi:hypothetical protein